MGFEVLRLLALVTDTAADFGDYGKDMVAGFAGDCSRWMDQNVDGLIRWSLRISCVVFEVVMFRRNQKAFILTYLSAESRAP